MSVRLGVCRTVNYAQAIDTVGTSGAAGFWPILTIDAADLVAGHSYVAVITGVLGAFYHNNPNDQWLAAQITAALGSGGTTFNWLNLLHSQDGKHTAWQAQYDSSRQRWLTGLRGLPFQMILQVTVPNPAVDFNVMGRLQVPRSSHPGGRALVENLTALLWDVTEITATSGVELVQASYTGSSITIPYQNQSLIRPVSVGASSAGTWVVYHSALVNSKNPVGNDRIGLDNTSSQHFNAPVAPAKMGATNPLVSTWWLGQQGVRDLALAESLSQWIHALYQSPASQGLYFRGEVLGVKCHADQQLFRYPTGKADQASFWGKPYEGTALGPTTFPIEFASDFWLFGSAGQTNVGAATLVLEINGGEFRPIQVHSQAPVGPVRNVPTVRVENPQLHDNSATRVRLWGEAYWEDLARFSSPQTGRDVQAYGFGLLAGYVPTADVLETKGAATPVVPGRETTLATASLPALPLAPSYAFSVDVQSEVRRLDIPRGDRITHPKFVGGRRLYRFVWTGLAAADGATLRDHLRTLASTGGGAFRYQLPKEAAETVFALDADSFGLEPGTDQRTYRASIDALELVFVVP